MYDILEAVVAQHTDEASFYWLLRDAAVGDHHYSQSDLATLDDHVEANIDGLRIAGDEGWEICKENLAWEEAGEIYRSFRRFIHPHSIHLFIILP